MANTKLSGVNKGYIIGVTALTILLPVISTFAESFKNDSSFSFEQAGKWFIFYAVGFRLLLAGIRQISNPAFTAKEIFHIDGTGSYPVVRELGFANLCFGLTGVMSLFFPQWRIVSAFASGLFYGIAGLYHFIKKPAGPNETFALISDIFIFVVLLIYVIETF